MPAQEARYDKELIDILPDLEARDFVFVRYETNAVCGIVTTADVVAVYRELSTPFFLIGELDQVLRQIIARSFTLDEITSLCDPDGRRSKRLDELRIVRNNVTHFNPDPVPAGTVEKLRSILKLLRDYAGLAT